MSISTETIQTVKALLQRGEKLAAIRHLRDNHGLSLEESKVLIETLEGKAPDADARQRLRSDAQLDEPVRAKVEELLTGGKKIEAIRYVKTALQLPLKRAKDLVRGVEKELGPTVPGTKGIFRGTAGITLLVFGGVGLLFAAVAGYFFIQQFQSVSNSYPVVGTVVRLTNDASNSGGKAPVIAYKWNGQEWLHASRIYTSPAAYAVNEQVPLYINRENPSDVIIDTFTDRWAVVLIFAILGLIFMLIPLVAAVLSRRVREVRGLSG